MIFHKGTKLAQLAWLIVTSHVMGVQRGRCHTLRPYMNHHSARNRFIVSATGVYLVFALAWIFLSDRLLASFTDINSLIWLSTAKGIFFVVATAGMFFIALRTVPPSDADVEPPILHVLSQSFTEERPAQWLGYTFAVLVTLLVVVVRVAIGDNAAEHPMLILFMMPIIFSTLVGGLGPGLVSTAIASACAYWLLKSSTPGSHGIGSLNVVQLGALLANGIAVSVLSAILRHALARAESQSRLLNDVVSGTSDAVFVKDRQGRYLLVNRAGAQFIGKSLPDILGKDDAHLFDNASGEHLMSMDRAIMEAGTTQTHEEKLKLLDGQELVFLVTKGPVRDANGAVA
ncbi:MAG: PAS domain-containing protein, partial [Pseudomonas fluorescens]|nr:PAS domain-containing protein [Pseudomonas fluorescens]